MGELFQAGRGAGEGLLHSLYTSDAPASPLLFFLGGYVCVGVFNRMTSNCILNVSKDYESVSRILDCSLLFVSFVFV